MTANGAALDALMEMEAEAIREITRDRARARDKALMCAGAAIALAEAGAIAPEMAAIVSDQFRERFEAAWNASKAGAA